MKNKLFIPGSFGRREFLAGSGSLFVGAMLAKPSFAAPSKSEPHFYLHLFFPGGMDPTYTFDARPLDMVDAKLLQNFLGREPESYVGSNGTKTLRTHLTNPLMPFMNRFSVLNGVVMSADFRGHEENQAITFTNNPFGGPSYFESFDYLVNPAAISSVQLGVKMVANPRIDATGLLHLTKSTAKNLAGRSKALPDLDKDPRLQTFFAERFALGDGEKGSRARTKQMLGTNLPKIPEIRKGFSNLKVSSEDSVDTPLQSVQLGLDIFKSGLSNSALYVFNTDLSEQNLDCHDIETSKAQTKTIGDLMQDLAKILDHLVNTPYDAKRSFIDVTTVVISTEFGRTMRAFDFETFGTDHNPLTNTFLIGGKGIRGGLVLGESDFASIGERDQLSQAHLQNDRERWLMMGRPYDMRTHRPRDNKPASFELTDYLTCGSVINTVFATLGIDKEHWRKQGRTGPAFEAIKPIMT